MDHDGVEVLTIGDYAGWYRERLARRHHLRAVKADGRLWTAEAVAKAEKV
ncbi:MAG: hypothetical protein NVV74_13350 [Magnetospirillum sp.]|nr:hypothetical protein [Magnetospirillum sp.]